MLFSNRHTYIIFFPQLERGVPCVVKICSLTLFLPGDFNETTYSQHRPFSAIVKILMLGFFFVRVLERNLTESRVKDLSPDNLFRHLIEENGAASFGAPCILVPYFLAWEMAIYRPKLDFQQYGALSGASLTIDHVERIERGNSTARYERIADLVNFAPLPLLQNSIKGAEL